MKTNKSELPPIYYSCTGSYFSWLINKGKGVFTQETFKGTCREMFIDSFRDKENNGKYNRDFIYHGNISFAYVPQVYPSKAVYNDNKNKYIERIKKFEKSINIIENFLKWPKTKTYLIINTKKSIPFYDTFIIKTSKRWARAPQLLSLYTLILRLFMNNKEEIDCIQDVNSLEQWIKQTASINKKRSDLQKFKKISIYLMIILKNYKEIFCKGVTMNTLYKTFFLNHGINAMMYGQCHPVIRKNFSLVLEKEKKKKKET